MRTNTFTTIEGSELKMGIIRARFNKDITGGMLNGAKEVLAEAGVKEENITVVEVPGSFELAVVAAKMIEQGGYDAIIALGCIIKGETSHDHHLATSVLGTLSNLAAESKIPITATVITVNNREQAEVRSGGTEMNRGREGARTALEMASIMKSL